MFLFKPSKVEFFYEQARLAIEKYIVIIAQPTIDQAGQGWAPALISAPRRQFWLAAEDPVLFYSNPRAAVVEATGAAAPARSACLFGHMGMTPTGELTYSLTADPLLRDVWFEKPFELENSVSKLTPKIKAEFERVGGFNLILVFMPFFF